MRRKHQMDCFVLTFSPERNMDSHLVTIKIRVVACAHTRMNSYSRPFNKDGVKRLNTKFMQGWRTIEKHRVILGNFFKNIKYFRRTALQDVFSILDVGSNTTNNKFPKHKGLEHFKRHFFGKAALR